jgi:hypothetical protein
MDMIERVARAICRSRNEDPDGPLGLRGPVFNGPYWMYYVQDARAAIEAMREPTPSMIDAAYEWTTDSPIHIWNDMIDAALK